jgi:hypothetical protein
MNSDRQVLSQEKESVDAHFATFASLIVVTTQIVPNLPVSITCRGSSPSSSIKKNLPVNQASPV